MTPEQRRFSLMKIIAENVITGKREETRPFVPEDLNLVLSGYRAFTEYRPLYAIRYRRRPPFNRRPNQ